jgi:hypothetical protein
MVDSAFDNCVCRVVISAAREAAMRVLVSAL